MSKIATIAGCPSPTSAATAALHYTHKVLAAVDVNTECISVRHLPSDDLLLGRAYSGPVRQSKQIIKQADGLIIATSICKGAYNGGLKAFFDLLPPDAFRGKIILPIAVGAKAADFAQVDNALRAVFSALDAGRLLEGIYLLDRQVQLYDRQVHFDVAAQQCLQIGVQALIRGVAEKPIIPFFRPVAYLPALGLR